jgi:hypothetical protein
MSDFHGLFSTGGLAGAAVATLAMGTGIGFAPHLLATVAGLLFPSFAVTGFLLPTPPPTARSGSGYRTARSWSLGCSR